MVSRGRATLPNRTRIAFLLLVLGACDGTASLSGDTLVQALDEGPATVDNGVSPDAAEPDATSPLDEGAEPADVPEPLDKGPEPLDGGPEPLDEGPEPPDAPEDTAEPIDLPEPDDPGSPPVDVPDTSEPPDVLLPDIDEPDIDEPDIAPFEYAYEPDGVCGTAAYDWLPPNEVGILLEWKELITFHLAPEAIKALAAGAGYPDLVPVEYGTRVFRIRYLTQDRGELIEATAMVGVPDVAATAEGLESFPTALWLHPTVGYGDKCAPSTSIVGAAGALLPAALGFFGVAPDFIGLCGTEKPCGGFHPYLVGEPTAIASWDAVRAAFQLIEEIQDDVKIAPQSTVVPWGASQGGHAALFADRYGPIYAPEFDVPCVIAMVPPADLLGQANVALKTLGSAAGLGTAFMAAAALWYQPEGGASTLFNSTGAVDYATTILETLPTTCEANDLFAGAGDISEVYDPDFLAAVEEGGLESVIPWGCIIGENSLPHTTVPYLGTSEILFILGEKDKLVDDEVEGESFVSLCEQGYSIQMLECAGGSHTGTALDTLPLQFEWISSCLGGTGIPEELLCVPTEPVDCKTL